MHTLCVAAHYAHTAIRIAFDAVRCVECANFQLTIMRRFIDMQIHFGMAHVFHNMQRRIEETRKFVANYIYYRKHNLSHDKAWSLAKNTL